MTLLAGIDARGIPSVSRASNPADKRFATRRDAWIAVGLAILCAALYLRTMAPDIVNADGGEFQFAAWTFSLAHPTGYPLFLVLGGLFQHLIPISTPAFRLNLFTLITAAAAVGTLYLAMRGLGVNAYGSALGSTAFALTTNFWFDAGGAEVYDLNAFFIALLILLALRNLQHGCHRAA